MSDSEEELPNYDNCIIRTHDDDSWASESDAEESDFQDMTVGIPKRITMPADLTVKDSLKFLCGITNYINGYLQRMERNKDVNWIQNHINLLNSILVSSSHLFQVEIEENDNRVYIRTDNVEPTDTQFSINPKTKESRKKTVDKNAPVPKKSNNSLVETQQETNNTSYIRNNFVESTEKDKQLPLNAEVKKIPISKKIKLPSVKTRQVAQKSSKKIKRNESVAKMDRDNEYENRRSKRISEITSASPLHLDKLAYVKSRIEKSLYGEALNGSMPISPRSTTLQRRNTENDASSKQNGTNSERSNSPDTVRPKRKALSFDGRQSKRMKSNLNQTVPRYTNGDTKRKLYSPQDGLARLNNTAPEI